MTPDTAPRLHRIDTNLTDSVHAQRWATDIGDTALAARWAAEVDRLLELRTAVAAGLVSARSVT